MVKDNFQFEVKVYRQIPACLKKQVEQLSKMCFDKKRTPQEQAKHDDQVSSGRDLIAFVLAVEGREVIGKIGVLKREIDFRSKKIQLGGIGGVCVREDKRNRGVAKAMLREAMKELSKAGCDVAYLNANPEKGPRLYGPFGFVFLNRKYTLLGKSGRRYFEDCGMVAPVNSRAIFEKIIADDKPFDIGTGNW